MDRFTAGAGEAKVHAQTGKGSWERPIGLFRTTYTSVMQARSWLPDKAGGIMWLGPHSALGTVFLPFPIGVTSLPESITRGQPLKLEKSSAYWAFRYVHNVARMRYDDLYSAIIKPNQAEQEAAGALLQERVDAGVTKAGPRGVNWSAITPLYANHTASVLEKWWSLVDQLVFRFADGFDNENGGAPLGYPAWWLQSAGADYEKGPPLVPDNQQQGAATSVAHNRAPVMNS